MDILVLLGLLAVLAVLTLGALVALVVWLVRRSAAPTAQRTDTREAEPSPRTRTSSGS